MPTAAEAVPGQSWKPEATSVFLIWVHGTQGLSSQVAGLGVREQGLRPGILIGDTDILKECPSAPLRLESHIYVVFLFPHKVSQRGSDT